MMIPRTGTSKLDVGKEDFSDYLGRLKLLGRAYPALRGFSQKIEAWKGSEGDLVRRMFESRYGGQLPGRCALLIFGEHRVESKEFLDPRQVAEFLSVSTKQENECRLWILEDLEPDWINVLGNHLGVDPLVFSEQTNAWNYTDSDSIPTRTLPSLINPEQSFTLRYYEMRRLHEAQVITHLADHKTFAMNWRRFERWRAIDPLSLGPLDRPTHGFVRRCASFWTNQCHGKTGWDAVVLVDPAFESFPWRTQDSTISRPSTTDPLSVGSTILKDTLKFTSIAELWRERAKYNNKRQERPVGVAQDMSVAYHASSTTFAEPSLYLLDRLGRTDLRENPLRNLNSPLDEIVYHWTHVADAELISAARTSAVGSAFYLLKYVANQWVNQLELIACGVSESEFFADDHQPTLDDNEEQDSEQKAWKARLSGIIYTTGVINYQKRQLNNFVQAINLNLERLGLDPGVHSARQGRSQSVLDAQLDFVFLRERLLLLADRISGLTNVANDLASLQTAFKSIEDGEFALRLSLFASVVFPMTLVTGMLSMGDDFLPGKARFWIFWAVSIPLVVIFTVALIYGRRPERWVKEQLRALKEQAKERKYVDQS